MSRWSTRRDGAIRCAGRGAHQRREADGRRGGVRGGGQGARKTEVTVPGQLALVIETETVVPAAVWETLPPERQLQVALRLARLLARLMEAARDE
jgi:hypothetical protein